MDVYSNVSSRSILLLLALPTVFCASSFTQVKRKDGWVGGSYMLRLVHIMIMIIVRAAGGVEGGL